MRIVLLSFLLCFCVPAFSQAYKPFPTDSAVWGFYFTSPSGNTFTKEILKGDTLLGGQAYHKVYSNTNALTGFYRENNKKMYAKVTSYPDTSEILIYDFNMLVGDTFYDKRTTTLNQTFFYKYLLSSITTASATSDTRKQYNFTWVGSQGAPSNYSNLGSACSFYWIEGVGSLKGVFNNRAVLTEGTECYQAALISNASFATLKCFEHKIIQYMPQSCNTLGVDEYQHLPGLQIYPNPAGNQLTIQSALPSEMLSIKIYDIEGRLLYDEKLNTSNNLSKLGLDLMNGVYLITIQNTSGESVTKKLLISN